MGYFTKITYSFIVGFIILFALNPIVTNSDLQLTTSSSDLTSNSEEIFLNQHGFAGFSFTVQNDYIHSTVNSTHAIFRYYGNSSEPTFYERYLYDLTENCTSFVVRVSLDYYTNSTSGTFDDYLKVFGVDHGIAEASVYDAWTSSEARYQAGAWPDGVGEDTETASDSAGTNGSVTMQIMRSGEFVDVTIWNRTNWEVLHSNQWSSGLTTLANAFAVNFKTGYLGAYTEAIFYDMYAAFNVTSTDPTATPTPSPSPSPSTPQNTTTYVPPTLIFGFSTGILSVTVAVIMGVMLFSKKRKN